MKQDSSDSLLSNYDSSDKSYYKSKKQYKKKSHRKKERNTIKLCAKLMAKLLTAAYKSKIIKLKLDEDSLNCQI